MFNPVDKMRYSDRIAQEVQSHILGGGLKRGDRLPSELDLAKKFQVSRSVIREAMRTLDGLGLITIKKGPGGGIFVHNGYHKPLSSSLQGLVDSGQVSVDHIMNVRLMIEPGVAAEAARKATDVDIKILSNLIEESEKCSDDAECMQANRGRFHVHLATATDNRVLEMFMQSLIELLREYFRDFKVIEFERHAIESQKQILEAIKTGDSEKARRHMENFILEIWSLVKDLDKSKKPDALNMDAGKSHKRPGLSSMR